MHPLKILAAVALVLLLAFPLAAQADHPVPTAPVTDLELKVFRYGPNPHGIPQSRTELPCDDPDGDLPPDVTRDEDGMLLLPEWFNPIRIEGIVRTADQPSEHWDVDVIWFDTLIKPPNLRRAFDDFWSHQNSGPHDRNRKRVWFRNFWQHDGEAYGVQLRVTGQESGVEIERYCEWRFEPNA